MGFIASQIHLPEYGETAALLLAMAEEMGYDPQYTVHTVLGGFEAPDAVTDVLQGKAIFTRDIGEVVALGNAGKTPPPGWDEPLPPVDIEVGEDGKIYLTAEAAQVIKDTVLDEGPEAVADELLILAAETIVASPGLSPYDPAIREWAKANDVPVGDKGRMAQSVLDAWTAAH